MNRPTTKLTKSKEKARVEFERDGERGRKNKLSWVKIEKMMILEELQTTLGNWRNESNRALKSEILSFWTLSTDVAIRKFYKVVEVSIRPLEIFLATFQEDW